ncbi:DUF5658 family protein [Cytobacillus oceanisediminis]|jgi:hypothetical protein|uniref:DUF5658 family protein n=1 Tax=Cytobacillus oceanisediminis TaxID=665099 RepID=UPI001C930274
MVYLLFYLTTLNLCDTLLTWFGLKYAFISELNPLMLTFNEISPLIFIITKVSLSILLLLFILFEKVPRSTLVKGLTVFASLAYTVVFCLHAFWLIQFV